MSHYTKNRNIVTIHIDGMNGEYTLDLSTGNLRGLRGKPVTTYPKPRVFADAFRSNYDHSNLARALYTIFGNGRGRTAILQREISSIKGAERMDAIGSPVLRYYRIEYFREIDENFEDFHAYLNSLENQEEIFYRDFLTFLNIRKVTKSMGNVANLFTPEMINEVIRYFGGDLTAKEWDFLAYYLVRGKYYQYHRGDLSRLREYVDLCKGMSKEPQKVNNFMREYCETLNEYNAKKTEYDNIRIRNNYLLHKEAFEFTFGGYTVVLPSCGQDIVDEGRNMHHCVGSYVNRVVENTTYIVFIRKTDTPNECYLTCQVSLEGDILQYYLAYDRTISSAEDKAFREAFQTHLKNNWKK